MDAGLDFGIDGLSKFNEVGAGGFAITYSAYEADQDRTVAVKVLHEADGDARRRFDRERRTMGNTTGHANIVTLFRSGYTSIGDKPYMVMEYLSGGSLQDRLDQDGPVGVDEAVRLILPVAEALGFSHRSGIVHKDVKPANILVSGAGVVKLTDFGIAALRETTTSQVAYTPSYTPPESFDAYRDAGGQLVDLRDGRSDLYSLAASLFTLVTGTPPFEGTQMAMMRQIVESPVPSTGHRGLDAFLGVAMAKQPGHRYQTADAFMDALRAFTADSAAVPAPSPGVSSPPVAPAWGVAPRPRPLTVDGVSDSEARTRQSGDHLVDGPVKASKWPAVVIVSVLALAVLGIVVFDAVRGEGTSADDEAGDAAAADDVVEGAADTDLDGVPLSGADGAEEGVVTFAGQTQGARATIQLLDGRLVSAGGDGVHIWDPDSPNATPQEYLGHGQVFTVLDMILLDDGRIASAAGGDVHVWDADDPSTTEVVFGDPLSLDGIVTELVELPDGRIASARGGVIDIWDPDDPAANQAAYLGHYSESVRALTVLPDGRVASAAGPIIHIWEPADPSTTQVVYNGHDTADVLEAAANADQGPDDLPLSVGVWVTDIVGLPDGRVVSAGRDGFQNPMHIWDPANPETAIETRITPNPAQALLVLDDGRIADGSDDGTVTIWSADDAQNFDADYTGHRDTIWGLTQLDDGRIASSSEDETVKIWDPSCEGIEPGFGSFEDFRCT